MANRLTGLLRRSAHELRSLFVDDALTVTLIIGWIGVACVCAPRLHLGMWSGPMLFAGIATISVVCSARR